MHVKLNWKIGIELHKTTKPENDFIYAQVLSRGEIQNESLISERYG